MANVHDPRVGVGRAAHTRGFERPIGEIVHHGFMALKSKDFNTERSESGLCAFRPGRQVQFLFWSELIHLHAHRFEFQLGDLPVDCLWDNVDLRL